MILSIFAAVITVTLCFGVCVCGYLCWRLSHLYIDNPGVHPDVQVVIHTNDHAVDQEVAHRDAVTTDAIHLEHEPPTKIHPREVKVTRQSVTAFVLQSMKSEMRSDWFWSRRESSLPPPLELPETKDDEEAVIPPGTTHRLWAASDRETTGDPPTVTSGDRDSPTKKQSVSDRFRSTRESMQMAFMPAKEKPSVGSKRGSQDLPTTLGLGTRFGRPRDSNPGFDEVTTTPRPPPPSKKASTTWTQRYRSVRESFRLPSRQPSTMPEDMPSERFDIWHPNHRDSTLPESYYTPSERDASRRDSHSNETFDFWNPMRKSSARSRRL